MSSLPMPQRVNVRDWVLGTLLLALTGLLTWQQLELSSYREESAKERQAIIKHLIEAKESTAAAEASAKKAETVAEATKKTVESTKVTAEVVQKDVAAVKKAVSEIDQ